MDAERTVRIRSHLRCYLLLTFFIFGSTADAQPSLNFKRVTVNWPTIELYFSVGCGGNPAYTMTKQDLRINENGLEVKDFTLWCPNPTIRCAISVSLVFDASGSMIGAGNAGAKQAGHAFVDLMDGVVDEVSIIWFNTQVTVFQQFTTIKPMLHSAVDAIPATGGTAVWDGIYAGLTELISTGLNPCRAVIALTDGADAASTRTPAEIIALANRHRIRVFTVGLGSGTSSTQLEQISQLTGGKYYQTPNAGQLAAIYQEISTVLFQGFQECYITYERQCMDGNLRTVELQLKDYCGGTDTKTKTYRAPLDSSMFTTLSMELGEGEGSNNTDIKIPLRLITPINDEMFYPFQFTLEFDPACVQFKSVTTPPGSLLMGMPITATSVPTGVLIQMMDRKLLNGSGILMEFTFHSGDPADTTCCGIRGGTPKFEQGCFLPVLDSSEICIIPRKPVVACNIDGPGELIWQRAIKEYTPYPFPITARFENTGNAVLVNTRFKITYSSADVRLVTPTTDTQEGTPKDIAPKAVTTVTWQLAAELRASGDSVDICITASFDNHPDVLCCMKVYIPPADPILECALDAPTIIADTVNRRYSPMPFPITVTVTNTGGIRTDSIWATIILPKDLELSTPDIPDLHTKHPIPSLLYSSQSGSATWMVNHPYTDVEKSYVVTVWVKSANADSTKCEITITIPPLVSPLLAPQCYVPSPLVFDESADQYVPNPFTVSLTCVNNGNTDAFNVEGAIILPPDLEFSPPGQIVTKQFTPSTMSQYVPPAPMPKLTWTVQWTKRYRYDVTPKICFRVTGKNFLGAELDTTEVCCAVLVPGVQPLLVCDAFEMPDSLALNSAGTDVEPNPFTVSSTIKNEGANIGRITRLYISLPTADGLSLDPSSPNPMNQTMSLDLARGESRTFEWIVKVENRLARRKAFISVTALDDEGNSILCVDYLPIAAVGTVGTGSVPLPRTTQLKQNHPNPFNPATTIEYHLGEAGEYTLTLFDALGRMLRVLDSGHKPAGKHTCVLDATDLPSGVYLYKLETAGFSETKRMILSR